MSSATAVVSADEAGPATRRRSTFLLAMCIAMLAIVLIGFGRTLYLRAFFDVPPIPRYLYVHGVIPTSWFAWLSMQASLIGVG